ncbi:MAG: tetratricopeptide repeat protein [Ignavibacteriota bacterium]
MRPHPGFERRAIEYLERAPRNNAEVLVHLAYLYEWSGDPAKAAPLYNRALQFDPSQVAAAANLGNYYVTAGRSREAIRLWRNALERSPGLETVRLSLALALYRSGDATGGVESLRKLLELNPAHADARRLLDEAKARR